MKRFRVRFYCHNGMWYDLWWDEEDWDKVKERVKKYILKKRSQGMLVSKLSKGKWEFTDEHAFIIGDDQGILIIQRYSHA